MPVAEITVQDSEMASGSPYGVISRIPYLVAQPDRTSTRATFETGDAQFGGPATAVVTGSGLLYDANGRLVGGTIMGVTHLDAGGSPMLTMTGPDGGSLGIDVAEVRASHSDYFASWSTDLDASGAGPQSGGGGIMVSGIGLGLSARSDHAVGSFRDDFIMGGDGGDDIAGGGSGDWLFGDDNYGFEGLEDPRGWGGRDTLRGGAGNDNLYGGAGGDTLYGGDGNDDLDGSHGADRLKGGAGNDWLWNVEGDDVADGGEGTDTLGFKAYAQDWGEPGRTVVVDLGAQTVRVDGESQGRSITSFENVVVSRGYAATVQGSAGANSLYGGDSGDSLAGDWGGDVLEGGYGDDILAGGQGNDTLNGDEGLDALFGGTGRDAFVFNGYSYSTPDVVKDFRSGEDVIRVRLNTAPFSAPAPIDPDRFKDLSQGPADADDLVLYDPGTGALYFARDGEPEVMAWLGAGTALAAADVEIAYI